MNPTEAKLAASLEALLFIHGEPLSKKKILAVLKMDEGTLASATAFLKEDLAREGRGLALLEAGDKFQLVTKPEFGSIMAEFVKEELEEDLTPAALEALSLILYLGPIPRSRLDYLRGVNSSFIVRSLMLRGLVERIPNPEKPAFYLYQATSDALRHLGVNSASELPEFSKFREMAEERPETPAEPVQ